MNIWQCVWLLRTIVNVDSIEDNLRMNSQIPQAESQGDAEDIWLDKDSGN